MKNPAFWYNKIMHFLRTYGRVFIAAAVFAFLAFGTTGIVHWGMDMRGDNQLAPCPFTGESAVCNMNPLEHIAAWQNAFTTTFQNERDVALLLLAFVFLFAVGFWKKLLAQKEPTALW
ncbi:MAG: hypothetical protein B7W98_02590, partial [Parcubacteria group bacterium 20-58-5]